MFTRACLQERVNRYPIGEDNFYMFIFLYDTT